MSHPAPGAAWPPPQGTPPELVALMERVRALPGEVRIELEPIVGEALEQAVYRGRVLSIAREALERFKLDLDLARFDLDATRREREEYRRRLGGDSE